VAKTFDDQRWMVRRWGRRDVCAAERRRSLFILVVSVSLVCWIVAGIVNVSIRVILRFTIGTATNSASGSKPIRQVPKNDSNRQCRPDDGSRQHAAQHELCCNSYPATRENSTHWASGELCNTSKREERKEEGWEQWGSSEQRRVNRITNECAGSHA
jgi:hypothetical protein